MSAFLGAVSITDKRGGELRLQERNRGYHAVTHRPLYRCARINGWHCGHWHWTPEDAVACVVARGVSA